jgi:hypothetical protein
MKKNVTGEEESRLIIGLTSWSDVVNFCIAAWSVIVRDWKSGRGGERMASAGVVGLQRDSISSIVLLQVLTTEVFLSYTYQLLKVCGFDQPARSQKRYQTLQHGLRKGIPTIHALSNRGINSSISGRQSSTNGPIPARPRATSTLRISFDPRQLMYVIEKNMLKSLPPDGADPGDCSLRLRCATFAMALVAKWDSVEAEFLGSHPGRHQASVDDEDTSR